MRSEYKCRRAIVAMYQALKLYAEGYHQALPENTLGEDYVIGDDWIAAVKALDGLLNGPTGSLNCAQLDTALRDLAEANGFTRDFEQP